jgi:glyoxylase-like metal-dependent hydrolase (beta-lactamase superfamily II)
MRVLRLLVVAGIIAFVLVGARAGAQVVRTADPLKRGLKEADFPRVQKLADGVYSYEQLRSAGSERFTTVSLIVVTSEGVVVADGQGSVPETRRLIDTIARITPQPITHVVICSDHGDHTAGNAAFAADVTFLIHPTSHDALETSGVMRATPMTDVTKDVTTLTLGGREIQILFLGRAHTGGDLSVYLPKERILFMSEAYLNRVFPAMRSAFPTEWLGVIDRALKMNVDLYVPGHGFVESPAILKEELGTARRALQQVIAEGRRLHALGLDADAAVAKANFGDLDTWTLRESQGPIAIRRVYLEIEGKLPRNP